ncbi:MAG: TetR/AcrR family transcriptional regulator, partial [Gordonia amarae]
LTAISMIGGLTALFTAYLDGRLQLDRERFIDYCVALLTTRIVD